MESSKQLTVLNSPLPLKAYPKEKLKEVIYKEFIVWLSSLLSLTDETSAKRLYTAIPAIEEHCWSMGFLEIKKMFEMYADGKLSIEPMPNYFDRILFGKIVTAYKMIKPKKLDPIEKAEEHLRLYKFKETIIYFDAFVQDNELPDEAVWVYDYLEYMDILSPTKEEKTVKYRIAQERTKTQAEAITMSKLMLLKDFFARINAKGKHIKELL